MGLFNKIMGDDSTNNYTDDNISDQFYSVSVEQSLAEDGSTKMILLEPRACSEAKQIVDHLKKRTTVVINLKRVTEKQAKRIVDYVSGAVCAIDGDIQKISDGTFLCAPKNMHVQGKITDEKENNKDKEDSKENTKDKNIDVEW